MIGLFYEELDLGRELQLGTYLFTEDNISSFKQRFAPVPFHLSQAAAAAGLFGKPVAVGFHICSAWMICFVATNSAAREKRVAESQPLPEIGPSPGLQNIRWPLPVSAGDVISFSTRIIAKRELASRPTWGMLTSLNQGFNEKGQQVLSFESKVLTARRL